MSLKAWIKNYIEVQKKLLDTLSVEEIQSIIDVFTELHRSGRQIFIFGNGGSATNASHFTTDLGKCSSDALSKRFRCFSLNENVSWITALGNDDSYADIFVRQLENYANPGDLVMAFSVSGNSPNLVRAFEWAKAHDLYTLAFIGGKGGKLAEIAEKTLIIQSEHYGHAEDMQMMIAHMICYAFIENPEIEQLKA
jgi:D-sedoheptulose 7-phosphate isomerase